MSPTRTRIVRRLIALSVAALLTFPAATLVSENSDRNARPPAQAEQQHK